MENLVKKAKNGDSEAFGKLYDAYMPAMFRYIFVKVSNKADAEDIAHQVFINAWQNISRYTQKGTPFSSWLYRIAKNAVIDFYRTSRKPLNIELVGEEASSYNHHFDKEIDISLRMNSVKKALLKLDNDQQNVLLMRFMNDLSYKEISEAIDKSEGAIRVIQHRALKQLRKIIYESERNNQGIKDA